LLDALPAGRSNTRPSAFGGQVAQLVEQRIENPRVGGSIPPLATIQRRDVQAPAIRCNSDVSAGRRGFPCHQARSDELNGNQCAAAAVGGNRESHLRPRGPERCFARRWLIAGVWRSSRAASRGVCPVTPPRGPRRLERICPANSRAFAVRVLGMPQVVENAPRVPPPHEPLIWVNASFMG